MSYNVQIRNQSGQGLRGTLYFNAAGGDALGEAIIPVGGADVDPPDGTFHFMVTSPGYGFLSTSQLYEEGNIFTLYKEENVLLYALGGAAVAYLVAWLTLKKRKHG